ncbi:MAG: glycosyltransferase [Candidatus Bathyarchaeia archaeon]
MRPVIVVPVLNEAEYIGVMLESALSQDADSDVVVIDGGSTDGTVDVAERYGVRVIVLLGSKLRARDYAYRNLPYEVQLHTDGDVILPSGWVRLMCSHFDDPSVVAVAGTTDLGLIGVLLRPLYLAHFGSRLSGRSNAVRRSAYIASGGFDNLEPRTGTECIAEEEVKLYRKMARIGRVVLETRVPVVHLRWTSHFSDGVRRTAKP